MPQYLIHRNGAFNIFDTVWDTCSFDHALTQAQLERWYRKQYGEQGMRELPKRIARAIATGTSSRHSTLAGHITCNRSGPKEATISGPEFIDRFLTLKCNAIEDSPQ